jgi:hypothetical protein
MRLITIALSAALTVLSGCASTSKVMDGIMSSWLGASAEEAVAQWGYPHEERQVLGRTLLVWNRSLQWAMPATATTTGTVNRIGNTAYVPGTTSVIGGGVTSFNCTRILEIDAGRRVVAYQWEGNNCPFMEAGPYSAWRRK